MEKGKIYLIPTTLGENAQVEYSIPAFVSEIVNTIEHYIVENEKTARHYLKKLQIQRPLQELQLFPLNKFTPVEDKGLNLLKPIIYCNNKQQKLSS